MSKLLSKLEQQIKDQAQKYYTDGSNTVSDEEFDSMINTVRSIDPNSDILTTGWGYDVNQDTTPGKKVHHKYGLIGSLNKIHSYDEFTQEFVQSDYQLCSLKLDGLSVVLYYQDGILVDAVTRGDGTVGISIIDKIPYIDKQLLQLEDIYFTGAIRGEILMPTRQFTVFKKYNPEAKNPRNAAAGLINRKDKYQDLKYLKIVVYTVVGDENNPTDIFVNLQQMIYFLECNFTNVAPYKIVSLQSMSDGLFDKFVIQLKDKWYTQYPADGLVFTCNWYYDVITQEIGYNAIAYKYPTEGKLSKVTGVRWDMSKTHYAIPVVNIEPIELAGTTVVNASGHNAKNIRDNHIGEGAIVRITKANEIIPYVEEVIKPCNTSGMISRCPECGELLRWSGVHLECVNPDCPNTVWQDTLQWINLLAPLDNFGDLLRKKYLIQCFKTDGPISIKQVMNGTLLTYSKNLSDELKQNQLFKQFVDLLYHSKITPGIAIEALNIPRFGSITCNKLGQYPEYISQLKDGEIPVELKAAIGSANFDSIVNNINKFRRLNLIWDRIVFKHIDSRGKVAITGKLSIKRKDFENLLRDAGFTPVSSVTEDVICLITDGPQSATTKNRQADKYNIPKISESDFRKQYLN